MLARKVSTVPLDFLCNDVNLPENIPVGTGIGLDEISLWEHPLAIAVNAISEIFKVFVIACIFSDYVSEH